MRDEEVGLQALSWRPSLTLLGITKLGSKEILQIFTVIGRVWSSVSRYPHWHLVLSSFYLLVSLMGVKWYLVASLCISLVTSEDEHFSHVVYLGFPFCESPVYVSVLLRPFGVVFFFTYWYIFWIWILLVICIAVIFFSLWIVFLCFDVFCCIVVLQYN